MQEIPPGFRFYPVEEELVDFYLRSKLEGKRQDIDRVIRVVDIYAHEPWDLSKHSGELCNGDTEQWFFFTPRQEREARGGRPNRTTATGYWKATGSPSYVYSSDNRVIGVKKTMVFYKGKAPTGRKTKWKMNEYRAIEEVINPDNVATPKLRHEFSLCRVYVISGNFRAYDRRPLEIAGDEQCDVAGTSSQTTTLVPGKGATSSGTSDSELADLVVPSGNLSTQNRGAGFGTTGTSDLRDHVESSGTRTDEEMNEGLERTLLEWEQEWPHF